MEGDWPNIDLTILMGLLGKMFWKETGVLQFGLKIEVQDELLKSLVGGI